jgi:23S rRNA pseudouridine1911/1915/1917 synthase
MKVGGRELRELEARWQLPAGQTGAPLDRALRERLGAVSWGEVRKLVRAGHVLVDGRVVTQADLRLGAGAELCIAARPSEHRKAAAAELPVTGAQKATSPRAPAERPLVLYADSQLVVVDKPAGISSVPYDETEMDTLDRRVARVLAERGSRAKLLTVHRLDKETSGVLVFARTHHALERLKSQFRFKTTERRYLAVAHGAVRAARLESSLVKDRGDGLRGSTKHPTLGRPARTDVTPLETLSGATLIACRLGTGRTHQIRIHLAEAGHPLVGERVYSRGYSGALLPAPRVLLHAEHLAFDHPTDQRRLSFDSPLPADFVEALAALRARALR